VSVGPRDLDHALFARRRHTIGHESFRRKSMEDDGSLIGGRYKARFAAAVLAEPGRVVRLSPLHIATTHANQPGIHIPYLAALQQALD